MIKSKLKLRKSRIVFFMALALCTISLPAYDHSTYRVGDMQFSKYGVKLTVEVTKHSSGKIKLNFIGDAYKYRFFYELGPTSVEDLMVTLQPKTASHFPNEDSGLVKIELKTMSFGKGWKAGSSSAHTVLSNIDYDKWKVVHVTATIYDGHMSVGPLWPIAPKKQTLAYLYWGNLKYPVVDVVDYHKFFQNNYIDIMFVYDVHAALHELGNQTPELWQEGMLAKAQVFTASSNEVLANSGLNFRFRITGIGMKNYGFDYNNGNIYELLLNVKARESIQNDRTTYKADIVIAFTDTSSINSTGPGGYAAGLADVHADSEEAYVVLTRLATVSSMAMVHEIGHIFGCTHEDNAGTYRPFINRNKGFSTVMASGDGRVGNLLIPVFSAKNRVFSVNSRLYPIGSQLENSRECMENRYYEVKDFR